MLCNTGDNVAVKGDPLLSVIMSDSEGMSCVGEDVIVDVVLL